MSQYKMVKRSVQQKRQAGVPLTASETKDLADKVEFLARNLQIMQQSPMEYEISLSELARRQVITENLRKQVPMIATEQKRLVGGPAAGLAAGAAAGNSTSTPSDSTSNPMISPYSNVTNKGLIQRQKEILKMQDEAIEDISKGVDRLHNQALEIGVETELQLKVSYFICDYIFRMEAVQIFLFCSQSR